MIGGAGGNIAVQVGADGVVLVDAGIEAATGKVLAEIGKLSARPIRAIITSSPSLDRIGGNDRLAKAGSPLYFAMNQGGASIPGAQLIGHEGAVTVLGKESSVPSTLWPYDTFFGALKTIYANDEAVEIQHVPAAQTGGDVFVFFRRSDVLASGPLFDTTAYPRFDPARGGSLQGIIEGLNRIIDLTVPAYNQMGGTRVIPGRGRIANESDVVEYRDMATIVRRRVELLARSGKSLAEVRAGKVSLEYDGIYGATAGNWTTERFIAAVYEEVKGR
jgi:glyoxylase-like metal-dependent hydrolase (beta-lactamase superfamily II)